MADPILKLLGQGLLPLLDLLDGLRDVVRDLIQLRPNVREPLLDRLGEERGVETDGLCFLSSRSEGFQNVCRQNKEWVDANGQMVTCHVQGVVTLRKQKKHFQYNGVLKVCQIAL